MVGKNIVNKRCRMCRDAWCKVCKVFEYHHQTPCARCLNIKHLAQSRRAAKYFTSTFLAWVVLYITFKPCITCCFCMYNYNTLYGEASHSNRSCYMQIFNICIIQMVQAWHWVVLEKIHTPPTEEISAVRRGRGEKPVSDNSGDIRRG